MRDISYPPIILTAKVLFRVLGLSFQMAGTEHVPKTGGALLAFNHVSYIDFILGGFAAQPSHRLVRFMAKREVFDHSIGGPVMRSMHHISVDRADGGARWTRRCATSRTERWSGSSPRRRSAAPSRSRSSSRARPGSRPRPAYP